MADAETKKLFIRFEKKINHMYQDSRGNVTIGIGHLIRKSGLSLIKLKLDSINTFAHSDKKNHDYDAVKNAPRGKPASYYKQYTNLVISDNEINRLYESDVYEIERLVKYYFKQYNTYPLGVRRVLLDMGYNKGPKGTSDYRDGKFKKAIEEGNWLAASKLCIRPGIQDDRNAWAKNIFLLLDKKYRYSANYRAS